MGAGVGDAACVEVVVTLRGESFSNLFYDNLPQIVIGLGEGHLGPREKWLQVDGAQA
jgi:hypothetical protein